MCGVFVESYETLDELRKHLSIDCGALSLCVNNKTRSMAGYRWTWRGVSLEDWQPTIASGYTTSRSRTIYKRDKITNDVLEVYPSISIASKDINKHPNTIAGAIDVFGKRGPATAGGFVWTTK
jgi:hypothetical protein